MKSDKDSASTLPPSQPTQDPRKLSQKDMDRIRTTLKLRSQKREAERGKANSKSQPTKKEKLRRILASLSPKARVSVLTAVLEQKQINEQNADGSVFGAEGQASDEMSAIELSINHDITRA